MSWISFQSKSFNTCLIESFPESLPMDMPRPAGIRQSTVAEQRRQRERAAKSPRQWRNGSSVLMLLLHRNIY